MDEQQSDLTEMQIDDFVKQPNIDLNWVRHQNQRSIAHMRHLTMLSFLNESRFAIERDHFYNEVHKRLGINIESGEQAEGFIAQIMNSKDADSLLRATAPGALQAMDEYIASFKIDTTLKVADYPMNMVTPEFKEQMQVTQAYANRIGGFEGNQNFIDSLKSFKEPFIKGLGEPKVGLAISGSMLGMAVLAGTGPAGLVIGGLKFSQHLLNTQRGKIFQQGLFSHASNFLTKIGVDPQVVVNMKDSVKSIWDKTLGTKWGKIACYGAAAYGLMACTSLSVATAGDITPTTTVPEPLSDIAQSDSIEKLSTDTHEIEYAKEATALAPETVAVDVKSGDTLWDIAKQTLQEQSPGEQPNNVQIINKVNQIASFNELDNPDLIYSGQTIEIPTGELPSKDIVTGPTDWIDQSSIQEMAPKEEMDFAQRLEGWKEDIKGNSVSDANDPAESSEFSAAVASGATAVAVYAAVKRRDEEETSKKKGPSM